MANIAIFRINYKSDFILTLNSDAGWLTPFCIKFWTGAPSQAYFVGFDGTTYTHCAPVAGEPTKLLVQFDDHHLPIGDLKFQIGYHFTVADFPTSVEDEVINQASVIIEVDGAPAQVMLDLNGETAPEIEFSLPAYANEAQRIENEQQRIENEQQRIDNEQQRIDNEQTRQRNEGTRIENEQQRVQEFGQMKGDLEQATRDAAAAAENANEKGVYAKNQGDYAKQQGDYAKQQGDTAKADHERAEDDHRIAGEDHTQAGSDHTRAGEDHTQAGSDHTRAGEDHTRAGEDHTRAGEDHTRAESDHAAIEVFVDSLGAFDISAYHATGDVLAKYADLTAALGTNGANIPEALRKGGMSVKFVQSSDNMYVQWRLMSDTWSINVADWQGVDDEPTAGSDNLVKSGGIYAAIGNSNIINEDSFTKSSQKYVRYETGIEESSQAQFYTYKLLIEKGKYNSIICSLILSNDVAAAIAFYSSSEVSTGTYLKTASIIGENTNDSQKEFRADIPGNCELIVITSYYNWASIKVIPKHYEGVSISNNIHNPQNELSVTEEFDAIKKLIKGDKTPIKQKKIENYCINSSNKFHYSANFDIYSIPNYEYKALNLKIYSVSSVNCIVFFSVPYIDSNNVISSISINGTYENEVDIPDNCKLIAVSNRKSELASPTIEISYGNLNIDDSLIKKIIISQPSSIINYISGSGVSLNIDTLFDDDVVSYSWQKRSPSNNYKNGNIGWEEFATSKNPTTTFTYASHLWDIRCVITFADITVISSTSTLHEYSLDYNPDYIFKEGNISNIIPISGSNGYIATNVNIGDSVVLTPVEYDGYNYIIANCSEGDRFTVIGLGANTGRLWAFIDSSNNLIAKSSPANVDSGIRKEIITAPANASKIIINVAAMHGYLIYKGYFQNNYILDGTNLISGNNKYIKTNVAIGQPVSLTPIEYNGYKYAVLYCHYGEKFTVVGKAGNAGRLWAFLDINNNLISSANSNERSLGNIIIAPENAIKLVLNVDVRYPHFWYRGEQYFIGDEIKCAAIEKASLVDLPKDKIAQPTIDFYNEMNTSIGDAAIAKGTIYKNGNYFCITYGENLIGNGIDIPELTPTGTLAMKYKFFELNNNVESNVSYGTFAQKGTQYIDIDGNNAVFIGGCGLPCGTINNIQYFSSVLSGDGHFLEQNQVPLCVCCPVTVDNSGVTFGTIRELSLTISGVRGKFDIGRINADYDSLYYTTSAPYYDGTTYHWCIPVKNSIAYIDSSDGINWELKCVVNVPFKLFGEITCTKMESSSVLFAARSQDSALYSKDCTYIGELTENGELLSLYKMTSIGVRPFILSTNNSKRKLLFVNTNSKNVIDVIEVLKRENKEFYFYKWFSITEKSTWYTSALQSLVATDFSEMYIVGGNGEAGSPAGMTFVKLSFSDKPKFIDDIPFGII